MSAANVARLFADQVAANGTAPAFLRVDELGRVSEVITYDRLHELVGAVAGGLQLRGIARGSRVVVFVPMGLELYVTLLALLRLGAVASFIQPWSGPRMVEHAADLVDADAFIGVPRSFLLRALSPSLRHIKLAIATGSRKVPRADRFVDLLRTPTSQRLLEPVELAPEDPALVTFTVGRSGIPIGTTHTHASLRAQDSALGRQAPDAGDAVVWTNLPVVVLHGLARGAATVLPPDDLGQAAVPDPKRLHRLVARSGATVLALSPAALGQLAKAPGRAPLDDVRRVFTGPGAVAPDLLDAARAVLPNARIVALYGTSEAEPIAAVTADDVVDRRAELRTHGGLFVGHEVPDVDVLIVRAIDGPLTLADGAQLQDWAVVDGAAGELLVAGDHVHADYWHDPEAVRTGKVIDEAGRTWHRTGDIARRDEHGGLWLLGPRGDGRTIAGRTTWSLELETPVTDLVEVERAALCMPRFDGANREFKNATAVLAVEPADGFTRRDAAQAAVRCLERRGFDVAIEVRALKQIPLDRRDPTRIDVDALHRKLKPQSNDDY